MSGQTPSRRVWIDIEGTGLDLGASSITEFAIVIAEMDGTEVASWSSAVRMRDDWQWDAVAYRMAVDSGLIARLEAGDGCDLADVDAFASCFIEAHGAVGSFLCGSSVGGYDRPMIRRQMPHTSAALHPYRCYDVTTLVELVRAEVSADAARKITDGQLSDHRALSDVRRSIAMERACVDALCGWTF